MINHLRHARIRHVAAHHRGHAAAHPHREHIAQRAEAEGIGCIEHVAQGGGFNLDKPSHGVVLRLQRAIGKDMRDSYMIPLQCAAHQQCTVAIERIFFRTQQ